MAQPRSLLQCWLTHAAFAAAICAASVPVARAQTRPVQSPEQIFNSKYPTYLRLLEGYRLYDESQARELSAFWEHLERTEPKAIPILIAMAPKSIGPLSQMALTDFALAALARTDKPVGNRHLAIAQMWVDYSLNSNPSPEQRRFAHEWYLAAIWLYFARSEEPEAAKLLESARAKFPNDPDVLLSSGTYEAIELTRRRIGAALARKVDPGGLHEASYALAAPQLQVLRALSYFREAIKVDPGNAEARLRQAWLLYTSRTLSFDEELKLLNETRTLAPKPPLSYLAALFAGRIEEELKHLDNAATWYRIAIAECPRAQTARLGLSHVQLDQNQINSARNSLRPLIGDPPREDRVCEPDPWRLYEFGQAWRLTDLILAMRKEVRELAESSQP